MEIWKPIKTYGGKYEVSSFGRVRNIQRPDKMLKQEKHPKGYLRVQLCNNKKRKMVRVHRLVAEAFLSNPENKTTVNHIDGNKANNRADNLEWATMSENRHHSIEKLGSRPWNTNTRRIKCIETGKEYCSIAYASKVTHYSYWKIRRNCLGKTRPNDALHWIYIQDPP